ncbi:hypothetical protein OPQ81_006375 [Rhizoctonia solani]|nr:hypothetical protein OPQ81_006375 [Rhizoctonia solani]
MLIVPRLLEPVSSSIILATSSMATSTNSTHTPSTTPRPAPQPSTPAQLFYGARGRSGSIASSFAKQQASSREHNTSPTPPLPPLPTSTSLNQNSSSHGHGHSSSLSSFTFTRSSTFPALSSPVRTTFGPGSPARSTFGEPLPPIRAGEPFRPSSPSTYTQTVPQRNPSPLGGPSLSLPPSTRGFNRVNSGTKTYSNGSTCSASPPPLHARSTSTVAEQIPLARLPSKQSREALIPSAASHVKNSSPEASFGAMLINAGKRASFGFSRGGLQARDERDKEKGWGDSVGGVRNPRESIVRFTRARSRSHSSGGSIRSSGSVEGSSHPRSALPTKSTRHPEPRRPAHVSSGWQPDLGPVVRNSKGKVMKQHELIASESRWFCSGHCVTGGGTRRVPAGERTIPGQDDWAYSVGATGYAYESTTATTPTTPEKREKIKRNRITLIPYPFVFSVLLVLGTAGSWMGTTCVWWWKNVSPGLAAAGAWLVLLVVVSMAKTAFADPGIVPRNLDPTPALDEEGIPYARDLFVRGIPVRVKYCVTCKTYRPLRSSHCRICDNCVDGCDHHCQWVNNCIGRRNYSTFITFLIACFLAILLMAVTAALHIYLQTQPKHGSKSFHKALGGTGVGSAVVFVVCAAVVWPVGTLLGYHIRLLALNVTTIEQLRNSAQVSIGGSGAAGPNAFSLGKWTRNAAWAFKLDHHNNKARMSRTPTPTSTTPTTRRAAMPPHPAFSAPYYPTTYQYQQQQPQQQPQPQQAPTQAHGFYDEHESRKRSASAAEQDEEDEAPSAGTSAAPTPREENKSKRTKTQRACDPCRRKKIRCDILPDTDPPICQHCKQYSFNCTFFLPITETRFKKKRMEEEQSGGECKHQQAP